MRLEIMRRAMEAFASMDIDAAKRCLGVVETTAELFPRMDMTQQIDDAALRPYEVNGMTMLPITDYYATTKTTKTPVMGAIGILRLTTRPEYRPDLS